MEPNTWHTIGGGHLDCLKAIRDRLYSEKRLTGDEMRDMAQQLEGIIGFATHTTEAE